MTFALRALAGAAVFAATLGASMAAAEEDPFIWMEEVKSEKALAWVRAQNERTLAELNAEPVYKALLDDATAILTASDRIPYVSHRNGLLYNFWQDDKHVLGLWRRTTVESYKTAEPQWEVLLDLDALSAAEGVKWSFKGAECLHPDFDRCLVSLSPGGGDAIEIREFDVATKSFVKDGFFVKTNKTNIEWIDRDTVLVGSDFGPGTTTESGYPRISKMWSRGTPIESAKLIYEGKTEDTGVWPVVIDTKEGTFPMVTRAVTFFSAENFFVTPEGATELLPIPVTAELRGIFKRQVMFSLREDWAAPDGKTYKQGALLSFSFDDWRASKALPALAEMFTPTERTALSGVATTADKAFVAVLDNVRGRVYAYSFEGGAWTNKAIDLPENGTASVAGADNFSQVVMFNYEDFLTPATLYWSFDDGATKEPVKALPARFDAAPYAIEQREATSADGVKIPYFIVGPKDRTGPMATLLYGYGGFEVSMDPWYWQTGGKLWLARGNVYVIANIRGGGEFGPRWHEAALKLNRQRAFDDFQAVAKDLIANGVTTPQQLGISGGSNGGLLVGVSFTQAPELFNAVLCDVPLLDMIRYTQLPPGASWIAEYGDPEIPEERAAIEKYSPYQNLSKDKTYPRVMFLTSTADDRVHPGHARKMAAKMESYGKPFLYFEELEGGHGAATNLLQRARQLALQYTYLAKQLGGK